VQRGVAFAVAGDFAATAEIFDQCVMCNLCTLACPERIWPNHLGLMVRRALAASILHPSDLIRRLNELERGDQVLDLSAAVSAEVAAPDER
jgi:succinate dehydrogenase/fumarate reductase-like Fe-S protein